MGLAWTIAALGCVLPAVQEAAQEAPPPVPSFRFHNVFWSNLHHFLYLEALPAPEPRALAVDDPDWTTAVEYYREHIVARDLLMDADLRRVDLALGEAQGREDLQGVPLEGELAFVLESAAPLYRAHLWAGHRRANAEWIATLEPLLEQHLRPVAERMAELFDAGWPAEPVRVDVLAYANWAGAYTSLGPDHIRVSSLIPRRETPPRAFELLVHEAGHLIVGGIEARLTAASRARGRPAPRDLWHAILFHTAGELVRASPVSPEDYVPYALAHRLYEGRWAGYRRAIEATWPAYLRGESTLDEAVERLLDGLEADPGAAGGARDG